MARPVNLFGEQKSHTSNEVKAQKQDAREELFSHEELSTPPPSWLPKSAKSEWDRLIPVLKQDLPISETDYSMLVSYCLAYSRIKTAEGEIKKYGTFITDEKTGTKKANPAVNVQSKAIADLRQCSSALGMTLEARSRLAYNKAKVEEPADPFKELMES